MPKTITVKVSRLVTFDVEVAISTEQDDDGCGAPSRTGNAMTGCRGTRLVVDEVSLADADAVMQAAIDAVDFDDAEITDALSGLSESEVDDEPEAEVCDE